MMDDFEQPTEVPVLPSFFRVLLLLLDFPRDKVEESDGKFSSIFQRRLDIYLFQFPQAEENVFRPLNILFHLGGFFFALNLLVVQEKRPPSSTPQIPAERKGGKRGRWRGGRKLEKTRKRKVRSSVLKWEEEEEEMGRRKAEEERDISIHTKSPPPLFLRTSGQVLKNGREKREKKSLRLFLS